MRGPQRAIPGRLGPSEYAALLASNFQSTRVTERRKALTLKAGVERAIEMVRQQVARGGKIVFVGNGGSAAIASHMATDFWKVGGLRAQAFNDASLLTCISNDFGYPHVFEKPIAMFVDQKDVLVAISSSGRSENILRAVSAARAVGAGVITYSGFLAGNPLRRRGDLNFYVPYTDYGPVEIAHLSLIHYCLDVHVATRTRRPGRQ